MNPDPPCDFSVFDVDGSGSVNLLDIIYLLNYLYRGGPPPQCPGEPVGDLIGVSGCGIPATADPPTNQDCFEYTYDGADNLSITHYNAGFNCCPGEISANITIEGNTITIEEMEETSMCDCQCLYNLDYEFSNLSPGTYTITFVEPYIRPEDPVLEGTIDLNGSGSDILCVMRYFYPWGM
jgi:hypothetical protein